MASLSSVNPPLLTTNASFSSSPSSLATSSFCPLFRKKSLIAPKIRKPHGSNVSRVACKASSSTSGGEGGRFDRRDLLIGLGGLYGATTLGGNPSALASPIQPPDLTKCNTPKDAMTGDIIDTQCCLPVRSRVIDFKPPPARKLRIRPAAHKLRKEYVDKFKEAVKIMKSLPPSDPCSFTVQANIHCAYCNAVYDQVGFPEIPLQVHFNWLFFPFHRWYLYFFERILGSLIGDPNFAIPFWNWDDPDGMQMPAIYTDVNSPLYDPLRNPNHLPPALVDLNAFDEGDPTTPEEIKKYNNAIMYREMLQGSKLPSLFYGEPFKQGQTPSQTAGSVEGGSHTAIHVWAGTTTGRNEDMGNFYSAGRDPIFYAHHGNVDRMWALWKTILDGTRGDITDPEWYESTFLFYDENRNLVRVKVADCMNTINLGYVYEMVPIYWLSEKPNPRRPGPPPRNVGSLFGAGASAIAAETSKNIKFPVDLDKKVTAMVKRPKISRSKKEKDDEEEVLVIEGIEYDPKTVTKFDVYVNDKDDDLTKPDKTEFAGSFMTVPHSHRDMNSKAKGRLRLALTDLLDDLGADDDEYVAVTLVPRRGSVTIGGLKIDYINE